MTPGFTLRTALTSALVASAVLALLVRCVSIAEPLGIDQSLWASAVRGMARGQLLYRDVWEQRPPGIYWVYLAGFRSFGWTAATVAWLDILASAVTTGLVYAITRRLSDPLCASLAAACYAVLTMPAWLYRHGGFLERSVSETFIVLCVGMAFWCAVAFRDRPSQVLALGAGLFAGAAVVFKPNAGLYLPAVLVWTLLYRRQSAGRTAGTMVRPIALALAGACILPAVAIVWLWRLELLGDAAVAVIDFNRFYVSQGVTAGGLALGFSKAVWLRMKTDPLWLAGGIGAIAALWDLGKSRRLPPIAAVAVLWGGTAALVILVNGIRLFNSYFIQALAPLSILAAWHLTQAARGSLIRRMIVGATVVLMLGLLIQRSYPARVFEFARADFGALRGGVDRPAYLERFGGYGNNRGYSARANAELSDYIRAHTAADDRIFLFGINGAGVYFHADRLTAHRFLRVNFFVTTDFPDPRFRLDAVVADLIVRRPRYVIFERLHSASEMGRAADALEEDPDVVRLLASYRLETRIEDFTLYRLVEP